MLPKAEKVSYRALLSIDLSRFLMNTLPTPDFLREGSLWDHMMRIGFPFTTSKFMVSSALSAGGGEVKGQRVCLWRLVEPASLKTVKLHVNILCTCLKTHQIASTANVPLHFDPKN